MIIKCDVVQHNALAIVETNVELSLDLRCQRWYLEVLPLDFSATKLIANSLWLDDFQRFEVTSQLAVLLCNETG